MDVIIQSLGFTAGNELETYVREKLSKLDHMADNIIRANVTLFKGPQGSTENNYCEIRLEVPGHDPFVKKNGNTYERSVVDAVDTLQEILRRTREKAVDSRRP